MAKTKSLNRLALLVIGISAIQIGTGKAAQGTPDVQGLVLSTYPDGVRALPKQLPELMQVATQRARQWRADAIPVSIDFENRDVPNPAMRGPAVRLSYLSPSIGTGLGVTVTTAGASTFAANQKVNWGTVALPPIFLDLPAAVRLARKNGMTRPVTRASLRIYRPSGAPSILAWMVGDRTVNGATGEIIAFDVTGYIARYNAQWEQAAKSLRALMSSGRGTTVPNAKNPWNDPLVDLLEIMNSTNLADCAAAGGDWRQDECKQR